MIVSPKTLRRRRAPAGRRRLAGARPAAAHEYEQSLANAVLDSLPGVFYLIDQRGKFLRWNKNFERVTGYADNEVAVMHTLQFIAEPDRELVAERIGEVFLTGWASVEAGFRTRSGESIPHYFTGARLEVAGTTCLMGVGIDISKRVAAEEAKWFSDARYRTLFDHAPDGILIADSSNQYVDANSSICRMLGYKHNELVGLHARDIVAHEELKRIDPALDQIISGDDHVGEWRLRRKDGTLFPVEVIATGMPDDKILAVVRDISERVLAQESLHLLNASLERKVSERTAELEHALTRAESADRVKSAFLATMSHELRTPLNSIIGFTGILLQRLAGPLTDEQEKQLNFVRSSGRHLLDLINDVLDLSKIEAGQLEVHAEPIDLRTSIQRVLDLVSPLAKKKSLAVVSHIPEWLPTMRSDRRRLEQILLNLLTNAIKFTVAGVVNLKVSLTPDGKSVRLAIEDTGVGIKDDDLAKLFQPFCQVDTGLSRQHQGTGLGLAICRRLSQLLGGSIEVVSTLSEGSTFTLTLPLPGGK